MGGVEGRLFLHDGQICSTSGKQTDGTTAGHVQVQSIWKGHSHGSICLHSKCLIVTIVR